MTAFMVNAFNLSDEPRTITGRIDLNAIGSNEDMLYHSPASWVSVGKGHLAVQVELAPWGTAVCHVESVL